MEYKITPEKMSENSFISNKDLQVPEIPSSQEEKDNQKESLFSDQMVIFKCQDTKLYDSYAKNIFRTPKVDLDLFNCQIKNLDTKHKKIYEKTPSTNIDNIKNTHSELLELTQLKSTNHNYFELYSKRKKSVDEHTRTESKTTIQLDNTKINNKKKPKTYSKNNI